MVPIGQTKVGGKIDGKRRERERERETGERGGRARAKLEQYVRLGLEDPTSRHRWI